MQELSFTISYIYAGMTILSLLGNTLVFYGFGTATERINKRVRDASFKNLMRQEVAYFDTRSVSGITSQLSDDAAMIHSFSGEPIRTLFMNLAGILVGLVVSFFFMWPFALVALGVLPFMAL
jgi:ATP-binding cassette subfamily B (MDR/TAP) protein 1